MDKYLVVGSPGRYRLQVVRPGGKDYESGMSEQAAETTRVDLNNKYFRDKRDKGEEPTIGQGKDLDDLRDYKGPDGLQSSSNESERDGSAQWVLISRKLYEANGTVSPQNSAALSTNPDSLLWYNTESQNTRNADVIPETAVVEGERIGSGSLGAEGLLTQEYLDQWAIANRSNILEKELEVNVNSSLNEILAAAKARGISPPNFGEGTDVTGDVVKRYLYNKILDDATIDKSLVLDLAKQNVSSSSVNAVEPPSEMNQASKSYQDAFQVTLYKNGEAIQVDVRNSQGYINDGWLTEDVTQDNSFSDEESTLTIYKNGQSRVILLSELKLYEADDWSTTNTAGSSTSSTSSQEFVSDQVIVLGPNGARTTAQRNKRPGEDMSEYDRLLAGLIPGREGYKDADKIDYEDTYGGHSTGESVSGDYKGDYGGEDASTPDSERESLKGAGNTGYDNKDYSSVVTGGGATGSGQFVGQPGSNQETSFNNIPTGAKVFDVDGDYYLGYLVPGGDGSLYTGSIYMMYQVPNNDFVKSGLLTDASAFKGANSFLTKEDLNTGGAIVAGTTVELEGIEGNPFLQFVERINDNVAISPWLATADGLALSAEVALEGRDPTPGEYRQLKWFQETTEEQRDWYELSLGRGFSNLPLDAKQSYENTRRNVKNNLLTLGIAGGFDPETGMLRDVPPGLVDYISQKAVTGEWSESKTTEQLRLFADPFAAGERDEAFFNVVEAGGYDQIDRQMQYEDTVRQEALKWLGPVAGNYNSTWVANWGSRLRSGETDAFQQLQTMLKQQRVALFDAYTNPELTYEDISQPWKNITENALGEIPDENQTYFQDIVKNNNVTYANEVLTKVGLEQGNDKVVNDALNSLEQSIGQGTVRRNLGANT